MSDLALLLVIALLLDAAFGEPDWLWSRVTHPAVLIGRFIGYADRRYNHGDLRVLKGAALVVFLVLGAFLLGVLLSAFGDLPTVLIAAILLAQRSLADHVSSVARALRISLDAGRKEVAKIVGRDTDEMASADVSRAAIESAAENMSDAVVAPAFWFLLLGLPGLLAYKAINTADSMIGYRTPRHDAFGKAAARLDDAVNFIPARLTALLICAVTGQLAKWRDVRRDAPLHRSPNAGWPEAAMAQGIGVALSGPRRYHGQLQEFPFVNETGRKHAGPSDIEAAVHVLWRTWGTLLAFCVLIALF